MSLNVVKEYVEFTKDYFYVSSKKIMGKHFNKELFTKYMDTYVNVRYYHQLDLVKSTMEANLNYYLGEVYNKDTSNTSKFLLELFKMYYYLDEVKKFDYDKDLKVFVNEICNIREEKVGIVDKEFSSEYKKYLSNIHQRKLKYVDSFDTNVFYLDLKDVLNDRYYASIKNNIAIPRLYSGYAIRRVWSSTVISENTLQIELYLLSQVILRDIIGCHFDDCYLVDFKVSLFSKKEKIKRVFDIIRNDICFSSISFNISYQDFLDNKDKVLQFIREGINFNVILDDTFLKDKSYGVLDIFQNIIITDSKYKIGKVSSKKNIVLLQGCDIRWILFLGFCMSF